MERRDFLKLSALSATGAALSQVAGAQAAGAQAGIDKPNIIFILADQRTYGLSKGTGYPLDTSPTLDRLQTEGCGFEHNYCTAPLCVPSRISMLTGRWPDAHRVRMNLQPKAAVYEKDIYQVAHERGYRTALVGKNHTYLTKDSVDVWREYSHEGGSAGLKRSKDEIAFDQWLHNLHYNVSTEPTPFPVDTQLPYRIMSDAMEFIDGSGAKPFLLQISMPEPHNPEQVPAPYWNMFPPDSIPERCAGPEALPKLGYRLQWEYAMQNDAAPQTEKQWRRYLSNYMGMLRLIDDQIKRLVQHLEAKGLARNTLVVFTTDHGDSLMNFGIGHKGLDVREPVTHIPQIWWGYGVKHTPAVNRAFTSGADLMPTFCEAMGAEIPHGVQGRSLWPLLRGESHPAEEFRSIYTSLGLGGLYYEESDHVPLTVGQDPNGAAFDELNKVTLSGNQKMVRMGEWKLVYDMMGYGQLYDLRHDPCELRNLFGKPAAATHQAELMAELSMWLIRLQDSLPTGPQNKKYGTKWPAQHNWYTPYRHGGPAPNAYIP